MILITTDQIFDLLANVSCETDVIVELEHYIISNRKAYTSFDLQLFEKSIDMLYEALIPRKNFKNGN